MTLEKRKNKTWQQFLSKWDTEELYTNYIAPVLESNVALIPGLTTNANVQEINASAVYYVQADASLHLVMLVELQITKQVTLVQ